jgi:hypothetical protein
LTAKLSASATVAYRKREASWAIEDAVSAHFTLAQLVVA